MPIPPRTDGAVAARPPRPSRTSLRKKAREARAAARASLDAAVAAALRRAPRAERLRAALEGGIDDARLVGDLAPYRLSVRPLHGVPTPEQRVGVALACEVEARVPGLLLGRAHGRHRVAWGVLRLLPFTDAFVRPLSTWSPPSRRPARVWRSLVEHLLAAFPLPPLLDLCLIDAARPEALRDVVAHVGAGRSFRAIGLPTVVNRAVAHAMSTPAGDVDSAMGLVRDAQARAVCLAPQARHVVATHWRLQRFLDDEPGLFQALEFLARHPEIPATDVEVICDGLGVMPGRLPGMKGRTPRSLVGLCRDAIAADRARREGHADVGPLPAVPFQGGRYVLVGDDRYDAPTFVVDPLRSGRALVEEGLAMRHCVGTYADKAKAGEVSIVAVGRELVDGRLKRAVTLEVALAARAVVQVRGRTNRRATEEEAAVIRCWAAEQGLSVSDTAF